MASRWVVRRFEQSCPSGKVGAGGLQIGPELVERVLLAAQGRKGHVERGEHAPELSMPNGERRLHHWRVVAQLRRPVTVSAVAWISGERHQLSVRRVRALIGSADPDMEETIKRTILPYFVLQGTVAALQGTDVMEEHGTPLPEPVLESIRKNGVAIKGPITTPVGSGVRSVNVALRQALDLYANVRPVRSLPGIEPRFERGGERIEQGSLGTGGAVGRHHAGPDLPDDLLPGVGGWAPPLRYIVFLMPVLALGAAAVGGMLANIHTAPLQRIEVFAKNLGLAFQITDDVLDVTSNPEVLGKDVGKDAQALGVEATVVVVHAEDDLCHRLCINARFWTQQRQGGAAFVEEPAGTGGSAEERKKGNPVGLERF